MTTPDHDRPDRADMTASLAVARAILHGADHATVHQAAMTPGACPACVATAGVSFMITATSTMAGDKLAVSERTRRLLLAAVEAAERDIRGESN